MADEARFPDISAFVALEVEQVWVWWSLRLVFDLGADGANAPSYVTVSKFRFFDRSGREHDIDIEANPEGAGPVLNLLHHKVTDASAENWELRLSFDDGSRLICPPDPQYEAWDAGSPEFETALFCPLGGVG